MEPLVERLLSLKVTVRDARAVEGITPERMTAYLTGHSWERIEPVGRFAVWWEKDIGQVVVPTSPKARDYVVRAVDLLNTVALVEDRSALAVMLDLAGDGTASRL